MIAKDVVLLHSQPVSHTNHLLAQAQHWCLCLRGPLWLPLFPTQLRSRPLYQQLLGLPDLQLHQIQEFLKTRLVQGKQGQITSHHTYAINCQIEESRNPQPIDFKPSVIVFKPFLPCITRSITVFLFHLFDTLSISGRMW